MLDPDLYIKSRLKRHQTTFIWRLNLLDSSLNNLTLLSRCIGRSWTWRWRAAPPLIIVAMTTNNAIAPQPVTQWLCNSTHTVVRHQQCWGSILGMGCVWFAFLPNPPGPHSVLRRSTPYDALPPQPVTKWLRNLAHIVVRHQQCWGSVLGMGCVWFGFSPDLPWPQPTWPSSK